MQNLQLEEYLIGIFLKDSNALEKYKSAVDVRTQSDIFYHDRTRELFNIILHIQSAGLPVDPIVVLDKIKDNPLFPDAIDYLVHLNGIVATANLEAVIALLIDKYKRRQLLKTAEELKSSVADNNKSVIDIVSKVAQDIDTVQGYGEQDCSHISDKIITVLENLGAEKQRKLTTDFSDFDTITGGLSPTDFIILAARPGMGKTAFATDLMVNVCSSFDTPVVIFSLEMSSEQIIKRMISSRSKINQRDLESKKIDVNQSSKLENAILNLSQLNIFISDNPVINISQIGQQCKAIKTIKKNLGLVVVDYLQLITTPDNGNRQNELAAISRNLKILAKEIECPIVALSQLNRGVESRNNKRPLNSDLRDSGGLEQDADMILMLYRDEYYNPDTTDRNICELIITKNRHGPLGTIKLGFDSDHARFYNLMR